MGKVTTPTYRLETFTRYPNGGIKKDMWSWNTRKSPCQGIYKVEGKPSTENIKKVVDGIIKGYKIGGCNERISIMLGFIPIPFKAHVIHQKSQSIIATWEASAFECF